MNTEELQIQMQNINYRLDMLRAELKNKLTPKIKVLKQIEFNYLSDLYNYYEDKFLKKIKMR